MTLLNTKQIFLKYFEGDIKYAIIEISVKNRKYWERAERWNIHLSNLTKKIKITILIFWKVGLLNTLASAIKDTLSSSSQMQIQKTFYRKMIDFKNTTSSNMLWSIQTHFMNIKLLVLGFYSFIKISYWNVNYNSANHVTVINRYGAIHMPAVLFSFKIIFSTKTA